MSDSRKPTERRTRDFVWLGLGAFVLLAFVVILVAAPTSQRSADAATAAGTTTGFRKTSPGATSPRADREAKAAVAPLPTTSPERKKQDTTSDARTVRSTTVDQEDAVERAGSVDAFPRCEELATAGKAQTCRGKKRTVAVAAGTTPIVVRQLAVQATDIRFSGGQEGATRTLRIDVNASATVRPNQLAREQFYLGFENRRYTPAEITPQAVDVPRGRPRAFALNFALPPRVAARIVSPERRVRLVFASFGERAATAPRVGVIVLSLAKSSAKP